MSRLLLLLVSTVTLTSAAQTLSSPFFLDTPVQGPAGADQQRPDVTWTGSEFLVVWDDARTEQGLDVWAATVDATGATVLANRPLLTAVGNQRAASVAMGTGAALVTWLDDTACASEVMAALVTPSLSLMGAPQRLSTGACTNDRPSVAWNPMASTWLVAWGNHGASRDLRMRLVSANGTASTEFGVSAPNSASNPRLAAMGNDFVVVWQDDRTTAGTPGVLMALVSVSNGVGMQVPVEISTVGQTSPVVAASTTGAAVAWRESGVIRFRSFDQALTPTGPTQTFAPGDQPAITWLGTASDFCVTWEAPDNSGIGLFGRFTFGAQPFTVMPRQGYFDRRAARLAVGSGVLVAVAAGPSGFTTSDDVLFRTLFVLGSASLADAGLQQVSSGVPSVRDVRGAFDGARYLTVWRDEGRSAAGSDSMGQLLAPATGAWVGPDAGLRFSVGSANVVSAPEVAGGVGGFFVTWGDDGSGGALAGMNVSSSGVMQTQRVLSDQSSYVNVHASVFSGEGYLTFSLKDGTLRTRLTSPTSVRLQPETIVFETGGAPERVQAARVGDVSFAVFLSRDGGVDVRGARFGPDASVLDAAPVSLSALPGDEGDCTIAAGATDFLVGYTGATDAGREVFVSRVSTSGLVRDVPPLRVGVGTQPSLGWTGSSWLVSFRVADDIVAVRFDGTGQRLDAVPLVVAGSPSIERSPDVTSGPAGEALITWDGYSPAAQNFRAFGRLFTEAVATDAGAVSDAGAVTDAGAPVDAGAPEDSGVSTDAGVEPPDAGDFDDAGSITPDAPDAGAFVPTMRTLSVGCSAAPSLEWLLALLLISASRSRRTPSSG